MFFRQLFDADSSSYTYLIADPVSGQAALIDSVYEQASRDTRLMQELGFSLKYLLETHVHADHVTAASILRQAFPAAQIALAAAAGAECADILLADNQVLQLGELVIKVIATPGHTDGCLSYYVPAGQLVMTGDALFIRGCGRTDFQQGDPGQLYDSVTGKLFRLPDQTAVYPGHNYCGFTASSICEEKCFNPRLAGKSREEFISIMNGLKLAPPKHLERAVPANLRCGELVAGN